MIVFGGNPNYGSCYGTANDVWVLENANGVGTPNWIQLSPTGELPSQCNSHTSVYDPATNRMIVFGGYTGVTRDDVWVLENANGLDATGHPATPKWTQLSPTGGPPDPRAHHSAVYDPATNRMIVFGGWNGPSYNDVWVLENANGVVGTPTWIPLSPDPDPVTGQPPVTRELHTAVYNPLTNRMIVFAGQTRPTNVTLNDVWVLTHASGLANEPPVANAGPDQTVECTSPTTTPVTLDGSSSSDPDSDELTFTWTNSFGTATGINPTVPLGLGLHTVTLTVDDGNGGTDTDDVVVTVVDTIAPVVSASDITLEAT